jgi:hypothetical protein
LERRSADRIILAFLHILFFCGLNGMPPWEGLLRSPGQSVNKKLAKFSENVTFGQNSHIDPVVPLRGEKGVGRFRFGMEIITEEISSITQADTIFAHFWRPADPSARETWRGYGVSSAAALA